MYFKKTVQLFLLLFVVSFANGNSVLNFKIVEYFDDSLFDIRLGDGKKIIASNGAFSSENATIITNGKKQTGVLIGRDGNEADILVILSETTDAAISYDGGIYRISNHYGRLRVISSNNISILIENGAAAFHGSDAVDISFTATIDETGKTIYAGGVWSGVWHYKKDERAETTTIPPLSIFCMTAEAENINKIEVKTLNYYKANNSFISDAIPANIIPVLETINLVGETTIFKPVEPVETEQSSENQSGYSANNKIEFDIDEDIILEDVVDATTDRKKVESVKFNEMDKAYLNRFLFNLLGFQLSFVNTKIGANFALRTGWYPKVDLVGNKFELSLYLDFFLQPMEFANGTIFYKLNGNNNEWSFGTDQQGNTAGIVFDVIEDLSLKTGGVRYGFEESPLYIRAGSNIIKDDNLIYFSYSPSLFKPFYRANSFDIVYTAPFFRGEFYSENVATGGLFDMSLYFMSPERSMRIFGGHSFIIDTWELRENAGSADSIVLFHFNTVGKFIIFDLPSFGYEMYADADILFPFTVSTANGNSLYSEVFSKNPALLANFINCSAGQKWRFGNFKLSSDLVVSTTFAKTMPFSPLYTFFRRDYFESISEWYKSPPASALPDLKFGIKLGMNYQYKKIVGLGFYYIPALSYKSSLFGYDDRLLLDISVISPEGENIQVIFKTVVEWEAPFNSVASGINSVYANIFKKMLVCTNLDFKFIKTITLGFALGILPGVINTPDLLDFKGEVYLKYEFSPIDKKSDADKIKKIL